MRRWLAAPLALLACKADDVKVDPLDSADTADTANEARDPRFDALAAAMQSSLDASGAPGAAIAVFEGGEVVWAEGFGVTAPDGDTPVGPETLFRIGSVTKMMTAVALLQQEERGLVDFDAPITAAVPGLDFALDEAWADAIYPEHLITHTAGLYDYGELSSGPDDARLAELMLDYYDDTYWLMSPPGAIWNYSNPNFSLAGLAAEQADGRWYREIMMEDVFAPLGMDRTFFLGEEVLADGDWAAGLGPSWTTGTGTVTIEADSYDSAFMRPAGFAWSSVLDLARFATFLLDGDAAVLSEAHRQAMTSPRAPLQMGMEGQGYGYGVFTSEGFFLGEDFYDALLWSHGGDINGYAADLYILPDQDLGFAILASGSGAHLNGAVVEGLRLGVTEPAEAPDLSVDPASFAEVAGTYYDPYNVGRMILTETESGLTLEMPLLDRYGVPYSADVIPYLPGVFVIEVQGYQLPLSIIEDEGAPRWARTRFFVADRQAQAFTAAPEPDRAAVERALSRLAEVSEVPAPLRPPTP